MKHDAMSLESVADVNETLDKLARLERRGWWSWATALLIIFALTAGIATLSLASVRDKMLVSSQFELVGKGLFPIVILFTLFAIWQQAGIARVRRKLAIQVGMMATMEILRPPTAAVLRTRENRRETPRYYFDQRIKVRIGDEVIYGRSRDLSIHGIGVIIPKSLAADDRVVVEFSSKEDPERVVVAETILRHSRGFYHGFEFLNLSRNNEEVIQTVCAGAVETDPAGSISAL